MGVDVHVGLLYESLRAKAKNPFNKFGFKTFSQNDEDGLLAEIFRRVLGDRKGVFLEFGVEDGLECNTLALLFQGWRGLWVGDADLAFRVQGGSNLKYIKGFITLENIDIVMREARAVGELEFLSMDLDGNDVWFTERLLDLAPKVICVEYNGQIGFPGRFCMPYNASHRWAGDDFYGASLQVWIDLLHEYKLVACTLTGVNAFFVRSEFFGLFPEVPKQPSDIFVPPHYFKLPRGHRISPRTIEAGIAQAGVKQFPRCR